MTDQQRSTISTDSSCVTVITIFTCAQERQHELVEVLDQGIADVVARQPGFISANVHASLDLTRVVNYAQWQRVEDFDAIAKVPAIQEHHDRIMALAQSADPRLYAVRSVQAGASSGSGSS